MLAKKKREMTRNLGFGGIRQSELLQPDPCAASRKVINVDDRKESLDNCALKLITTEYVTECSTDDGASASGQSKGHTLPVGISKEVFFGDTTQMREGAPALGIEPTTFGQPRFDSAGKGNIHVITAEQQMVTNRHTLKLKLAFPLSHRNQTEIRGPTADITHEDRISGPELILPRICMRREPRIECRLRFFEKRDTRESSLLGGLDG